MSLSSLSRFTTASRWFVPNEDTPSIHYPVHSLQKPHFTHGQAHTFEPWTHISPDMNAEPHPITQSIRGDVHSMNYHLLYDKRNQDNWLRDLERLSATLTEESHSCHPPYAQSQDQAGSFLSEMGLLQMCSASCLGGDVLVTPGTPKRQDITTFQAQSTTVPAAVDDCAQLTGEQLTFIQRSFPQISAEHLQQRDRLGTVFLSPWIKANIFEPKNSRLLQDFLLHNYETGRWECTFWKNDRRCLMSYTRKDQAVSHIRVHINHNPYACKDIGPW
jgi:hypothetical protein